MGQGYSFETNIKSVEMRKIEKKYQKFGDKNKRRCEIGSVKISFPTSLEAKKKIMKMKWMKKESEGKIY